MIQNNDYFKKSHLQMHILAVHSVIHISYCHVTKVEISYYLSNILLRFHVSKILKGYVLIYFREKKKINPLSKEQLIQKKSVLKIDNIPLNTINFLYENTENLITCK